MAVENSLERADASCDEDGHSRRTGTNGFLASSMSAKLFVHIYIC